MEIGAAVPTRALYLVDRDHDDPAAYAGWLEVARPRLAHLTHDKGGVVMTTTQLSNIDQRTLRDAFGAFPSGVVAVAASVKGQLTGIAASSFTSISIEPPLVSFSVATSSSSWPLLREADHLGISVLADHHDDICRQLAGPREQRFDGLPFTVTEGGAVLLKEGVATFDVTVHDEIEAGDHRSCCCASTRSAPGTVSTRSSSTSRASPSCTATTSTRPASMGGSTAPTSRPTGGDADAA